MRGSFVSIFLFPSIRKADPLDKNFKKKCGYLALQFYLNGVVYWVYNVLVDVPFKIIPQHLQWILALLTPFPKMIFIKIYLKICSKGYGSIKPSVKTCVVHNFHIQHALFMCITMGYLATKATSYTILGLKFGLSLQSGLKTIYKLKYSKKAITMNEGMF